ncbi:hypothetical protein WMY93_002327 [Mugilogobius chulae]|uniref:Uncharacterized protein n=1 Tax=Mugilogobius chulae TaxID=88201 RepID=A0AAW0PZC4_9GOBI
MEEKRERERGRGEERTKKKKEKERRRRKKRKGKKKKRERGRKEKANENPPDARSAEKRTESRAPTDSAHAAPSHNSSPAIAAARLDAQQHDQLLQEPPAHPTAQPDPPPHPTQPPPAAAETLEDHRHATTPQARRAQRETRTHKDSTERTETKARNDPTICSEEDINRNRAKRTSRNKRSVSKNKNKRPRQERKPSKKTQTNSTQASPTNETRTNAAPTRTHEAYRTAEDRESKNAQMPPIPHNDTQQFSRPKRHPKQEKRTKKNNAPKKLEHERRATGTRRAPLKSPENQQKRRQKEKARQTTQERESRERPGRHAEEEHDERETTRGRPKSETQCSSLKLKRTKNRETAEKTNELKSKIRRQTETLKNRRNQKKKRTGGRRRKTKKWKENEE